MAFDEKLRAYLEGVDRGELESPQVRHRHVNPEALRQGFLHSLEEHADDAAFVQSAHSFWTPLLSPVARYVETLPEAVGYLSPEEAVALALSIIEASLAILDPGVALLQRLEAERLAHEFDTFAAVGARYARDTKLVRRGHAGESAVLTTLGRTFMRLPGKDGVRWLLTIETLLSRGTGDTLLASRDMLAEAMSAGGLVVSDGFLKTRFDPGMLSHANDLGVLHWGEESPEHSTPSYFVPSGMRDVVQGVLDRGPWHTAISAILEDERTTVVGTPSSTSSDAVLEQSRMITHEVRNALMPVRHHIDWIAPRLADADLQDRLGKVRRGVVRMLDFAEQMVKLTEAAQEPVTVTSFVELVREAVSLVEDSSEVEIATVPMTTLPIRARRSRVVLAFVNLLRNAVQAAVPPARVRISARVDGRNLRIDVDDNGRGVPAADRTVIFDDGYTTRPGGSGFGLAFVKRVVETELGGKVWCEQSDLGGARFSIEFPMTERAT